MKRFLIVSIAVLLVAVLAALVVPSVRGSSMPFNVGIMKKSVVFLYYPEGRVF